MLRATLAVCLGVVGAQQLPQLPAWPGGWLALLIPLFLAGRFSPWPRDLAWLLLGLVYTLWRAELSLEQRLPPVLEKQDFFLSGELISLPHSDARRTEFILRPTQIPPQISAHWPRPGKLRLSWYHRGERSIPDLQPGQQCHLQVRLKQPYGLRNPGSSDRETLAFRDGIAAVGYVREHTDNHCRATAGWSLARLRWQLLQQLQTALADTPHSGMIIAVTLGVRARMSQEEWQVLRRTGTAHLMAISGLHVGWVAFLCFWLGKWLWGRLGGDKLFPAQRVAALFALACAAFYAALAGFSVPSQRALIMIAAMLTPYLFLYRLRATQTLALALLLVLLWEPTAVTAAGFWLSFGAVAVIFYAFAGRVHPSRSDWRDKLKNWLSQFPPLAALRALLFAVFPALERPSAQAATQGLLQHSSRMTAGIHLVILFGLAPLLLFQFGQLPWISPLANFFAVPWMGWLVVPWALLGMLLLPVAPVLAESLLQGSAWSLYGLWQPLSGLSAHAPLLELPAPPLWTVWCAVVGVLLLLAARGFPGRWLGLVWCAPLVLIRPPQPASGEVWLTLLDTGQSLSAVARTENHVLVYDTGLGFADGPSQGASVVAPYLQAQGVQHIDLLLISHADRDHGGGAAGLLAAYPQTPVMSGAPEAFAEYGAFQCLPQRSWRWDGVEFRILHPQSAQYYGVSNNRSCVLQIRHGTQAILLTGDIETDVEAALLRNTGATLASTILQVPHHGSRSSSSPAFIDAVQPCFALFATGYRNRFGFPNAEVLARYRQRGIRTLSTAEQGAIQFVLSATATSEPHSYRATARRYWHRAYPVNHAFHPPSFCSSQ